MLIQRRGIMVRVENKKKERVGFTGAQCKEFDQQGLFQRSALPRTGMLPFLNGVRVGLAETIRYSSALIGINGQPKSEHTYPCQKTPE